MFYLKITVFIILFPLLTQAQTRQCWQGQQGSKRVLVELITTPEGNHQLFFTLPEAWVNRVEADSLAITPNGISGSRNPENIRFNGTFTSNRDLSRPLSRNITKRYTCVWEESIHYNRTTTRKIPVHPIPTSRKRLPTPRAIPSTCQAR